MLVAGILLTGIVDQAVLAAPSAGAPCVAAGRERTTSKGVFRCVQNLKGGTRWKLVSATGDSNSTSTTTTTSTTAMPIATSTNDDVRAPQITSVLVDNSQVEFTISGMEPDTGVYAVQWVREGSSFNTYQMLRATTKRVVISASTFACAATYSFRAFVMKSDWQLADGHQTQNVTPHSSLTSVTMSRPCTTPTSPPLTCASGGTCAIGDTGPGGGIVFYVAGGTFTSTGSDCGSNCKYLEAAPNDQSSSSNWCDVTLTLLSVGASAIGSGMSNTSTADATCSSGAIQLAADYINSGKSDWHLPSKDELNEMYLQNAVVGLVGNLYWSSTERFYFDAWAQFDNLFQDGKHKNLATYVRAVRAFG